MWPIIIRRLYLFFYLLAQHQPSDHSVKRGQVILTGVEGSGWMVGEVQTTCSSGPHRSLQKDAGAGSEEDQTSSAR